MALVRSKWKTSGRIIYYGGLLVYIVFLLLYTTFALHTSHSIEQKVPFCTNINGTAPFKSPEISTGLEAGILLICGVSILFELLELGWVSTKLCLLHTLSR